MPEIEVTIHPGGEVKIDAVGFQGQGCQTATRALEAALVAAGGRVTADTPKPELRQTAQATVNKQRLGS